MHPLYCSLHAHAAEKKAWCAKCGALQSALLAPCLLHGDSSLAGFIETANCAVVDAPRISALMQCGRCDGELRLPELIRGRTVQSGCRGCHAPLSLHMNNVQLTVVSLTGKTLGGKGASVEDEDEMEQLLKKLRKKNLDQFKVTAGTAGTAVTDRCKATAVTAVTAVSEQFKVAAVMAVTVVVLVTTATDQCMVHQAGSPACRPSHPSRALNDARRRTTAGDGPRHSAPTMQSPQCNHHNAITTMQSPQWQVMGLVIGKPLPNKGACKHYSHVRAVGLAPAPCIMLPCRGMHTSIPHARSHPHCSQSYRWLRFPCCGRAHPCAVCHEASDCPAAALGVWATRMLCGKCSRERRAHSRTAAVTVVTIVT